MAEILQRALPYLPIAVLILVALSVFLVRSPRGPGDMKTSTRFFLVCLRLAIGWHFFIEGVEKLNTPTWSSEPYLREATGPLAPYFRRLAGDRVVDDLTVDAAGAFPKDLAIRWQAYADAFSTHYGLDGEQRTKAQQVLEKSKEKTLEWLNRGKELAEVAAAFPPPLLIELTVEERLDQLEKLQAKVIDAEEKLADVESSQIPKYNDDAFANLKTAKANLGKWRSELKRDLDKQTADMKGALAGVLTSEQQTLAPLPGPAAIPVREWTYLEWSDQIVRYGLLVVGGCLLIGLFTRLSCVLAAGYLLMFFLAMPPMPGWPDPPRAEGHYLFINKNIIEMFACLALATTRSGRWAGVDGILQFLCPGRWRKTKTVGVRN